MKLIVFDMNGVIFQEINFWMELHKFYGTYKEGKILTDKYLHKNYKKLVSEVVGKLWKGNDAKPYYDLIKKTKYMKGVKPLFRELKKREYKTAIISSGPKDQALRAKKELGIDYIYSNNLIIRRGKISGDFKWPVGAGRKQTILRKLCEDHNIFYKDCIVVVHDTNDIKMAKTAGMTIAFNPISKDVERYSNVIIRKKDLKEVIKYLQ